MHIPKAHRSFGSSLKEFFETYSANRSLRLGVISNPLSGGTRSGFENIQRILHRYPSALHSEVKTLEDIETVLFEFARKEADVVVVNGGDGTIHGVLTVLFRSSPFDVLPPLALLRAGTASMIARDVGLRGPQGQALESLLCWAASGEPPPYILKRSVLQVARPGHEPLFGMFFGTAGIYEGIKFCLNRVHRMGFGGELAAGLTLLWSLRAVFSQKTDRISPVSVGFGLDGKPAHQQEVLLMLVSTLERLFLGIRPYWGVESGPLHFTAVSAQPQYLLRALPSLVRGSVGRYGTPANGFISHNVHEVQLNLRHGFTVDGELYRSSHQTEPITFSDAGDVSFIRS